MVGKSQPYLTLWGWKGQTTIDKLIVSLPILADVRSRRSMFCYQASYGQQQSYASCDPKS